MFFKKKDEVQLFRFLGVLPVIEFDKFQLEEIGEFLRVVLRKFYQKEKISEIKTFIEGIGLSLEDFIMEEVKIDENKNIINSEFEYKCSGPRINIPISIVRESNIYVDDVSLENALVKLKIPGFVPSIDSEYFTQSSWSELSKIYIQEYISLANNFTWVEGSTEVYENRNTGEISVLIVDFVSSPLNS